MSCISEAFTDLFTCPPPPPVSADPIQADIDARVYALVIVGKVLLALAAAVVILSITFAAVFNPLWALGLVAVVALAVFGCQLSKARNVRNSIVIPCLAPVPFYPGQPVGIPNGGCNCWANSMWQFLMRSPTYVAGVQGLNDAALNNNIAAYQQAGGAQRFLSAVNSQELRTTLSQRMGVVAAVNDPARAPVRGRGAAAPAPVVEYALNPQAFVQEDPAAPLEHLMRGAGFTTQMLQTVGGGRAIAQAPEVFVPLEFRHTREGEAFETHFRRYFQFQTDRGVEVRHHFPAAPQEFIVKQNRFFQQHDQHGRPIRMKYNQAVVVPERYTLPGEFVDGGGDDTPYECDEFISHLGQAVNSGHYVSYVKNRDAATGMETFWLCDDSIVTEVTRATYLAEMGRAYILHFRRLNG
jgi:hypothetical protein